MPNIQRLFAFALLVAAAIGAKAADLESPQASDTQPKLRETADFWRDGVGSGFRKGLTEVAVGGGYAIGVAAFGGQKEHNLAMGSVSAGWTISDVKLEKTILRGQWEVLGELFGGAQIDPKSAGLGGLDGFFRYNFVTGTRWVPFFEAGAGIVITDIGHPDLSTAFQFNEKAGIGTQYFVTDRVAVSFEVRFMHISNAGIASPNLGVNTVPLLVGVSYFF